jgi:molybdate transport system substrate-binding protein
MHTRRVVLILCALGTALVVACASSASRPTSSSTPVSNVAAPGLGAATPTPQGPPLLSGSGPEDDTTAVPTEGALSGGGAASAQPTLVPTPTVLTRQTADPSAVVVFAATPFGGAFSELGSDFMLSAPEATGVSYRFDNSSQLRNLIQTGADADVFVSMDPAQMDSLNQANLLASAPSVLVQDRLVIVVSQANPQSLRDFKDLANPGMRFIIPAPASTTSSAIQAAFSKASSDPTYGADFAAKADRNVLARDGDDRLVLDRITAGEVSAGIVYASSITPGSRAKVQVLAIPDSISAVADYPIAVLKHGTNLQGGRAFMQYALSAQAQDLLSRYGFSKAATANAAP